MKTNSMRHHPCLKAFLICWDITYQTVNNADVPLVLFEPQMHVLTNTVETAEGGGSAHLPVTLGNLHAHTNRLI